MTKKLILSGILLSLLFICICFFGIPKTILKADDDSQYNWTFELPQSNYRFNLYNQDETNPAYRLQYAVENILNYSIYNYDFDFYIIEGSNRIYYDSLRVEGNQVENNYQLYAFNTSNNAYLPLCEYIDNSSMSEYFHLYTGYLYFDDQSIILRYFLNYMFNWQHEIGSGWYSFTSANGLYTTQTTMGSYKITGLSRYIFEDDGYSTQFINRISLYVNNNSGDAAITFVPNNVVNSNEKLYESQYFKQFYFDSQYIDAVFWSYLIENGTFSYVELPSEPLSFFDLLDGFVAIPINITESMFNWSALGVNLLVAIGTVLVIITAIKVIRWLL